MSFFKEFMTLLEIYNSRFSVSRGLWALLLVAFFAMLRKAQFANLSRKKILFISTNSLVRLGGCPGWSESWVFAWRTGHFVGIVVRRLFFFFILNPKLHCFAFLCDRTCICIFCFAFLCDRTCACIFCNPSVLYTVQKYPQTLVDLKARRKYIQQIKVAKTLQQKANFTFCEIKKKRFKL